MFWLYLCTFLLSISIWTTPFHLYSKRRIVDTIWNSPRFYMALKIKSYLAIVPYMLLGSAFILYYFDSFADQAKGLLTIACISFLFPQIQFAVRKLVEKLIKKKESIENSRSIRNIAKGNTTISLSTAKSVMNRLSQYENLKILSRSLILNVVLIFLISVVLFYLNEEKSLAGLLIALFVFLSSSISFQLIYFNKNELDFKAIDIENYIRKLFSPENILDSKYTYRILATILVLAVVYYLAVPSLSGTNTFYVLSIVFSFNIIYLDLLRNWFQNCGWKGKTLSFVAIMVYITIPFLTPAEQFNIPFEKNMNQFNTLRSAIEARIGYIDSTCADTSNIYIISGMGGGSRAGYITSNVLSKLDSLYPGFYNQTLCYSSISGSSPGVYHYLKFKESNKKANFFSIIYNRNYNSSGVFGVLLGDYLEVFYGFVMSKTFSFIKKTPGKNDYNDRNVRIRQEYENGLSQAMNDTNRDYRRYSYGDKTFYHNGDSSDLFKAYFKKKGKKIPIHLINSCEVNSGRRTVVSPFTVYPDIIFPNAILPLENNLFGENAKNKDITYREATNLSELFPLISAASTIGDNYNSQFVDGGYYENYGLTTALDIYEFIEKHCPPNITKRLKFILIRNSNQLPIDDHTSYQLLAPLVAVMNAPFTGHANHIMTYIENRFGKDKFKIITFDADLYNVPLTRALTLGHIDSMDQFIVNIKRDSFYNYSGH